MARSTPVSAVHAKQHKGKTMDTYDQAAFERQVTPEEGERLRSYKDTVGKWTIGIGRNLDDVGISPDETKLLGITRESCMEHGITQPQCDVLFANDCARSAAALDAHLPWWRSLDKVRQRVLLDLTFNMGIHGLMQFKNTLSLIQQLKYNAAADALHQSKWDQQVGQRAPRLEKMLRTGIAA